MFKLSGKEFWLNLGKELIKGTATTIKNKSTKIYNNIKNTYPKLKITKLYEDIDEGFRRMHITILDGNIVLFNDDKIMHIINGNTFKIIKKLKTEINFRYISDVISLSKDEILFCSGHYRIR